MRPRPLLLSAAAVLAVVHVVGVLFARAVFRPAEVLATVCLLIYAVSVEFPADRHQAPAAGNDSPAGADGPAGGGPVGSWMARWGLSIAAAALVAGAALTVPPAPGQGSGLEWQVVSPEQYSGMVWRAGIESSAPVVAALLFGLAVLMAQRRIRPGRMEPGRIRPGRKGPGWMGPGRVGSGRVVAAAGFAAAVLVIGYVAVRSAVIEFGTSQASASTTGSAQVLSAVTATLVPLALALQRLNGRVDRCRSGVSA